MDSKSTIIFFLGMALLTIGVIYATNLIQNSNNQKELLIRNESFNQGYGQGISEVIYGIQTSGNIPYFQNVSGSLMIKTISITQLCNNLNNSGGK